jgi:CMP/dCMP kinase
VREVITIDGPAGAGKTTLGQWLADRLGWRYLETGLLFRAVAWAQLHPLEGELRDAETLAAGVRVEPRLPMPRGADQRQYVGTRQLTLEELRAPDVDALVTPAAANPSVRSMLNKIASDTITDGRCVVSGRDVGDAIAPDAMLKIVLGASDDVLFARLEGSERLEQERRLIPPAPNAPGILRLDTGRLAASEIRHAVLKRLEEVAGDSVG